MRLSLQVGYLMFVPQRVGVLEKEVRRAELTELLGWLTDY